ncbi:MAG: transcription-repair coupling factor [Thermodesulfobacteriota bacterium]
MAQNQEKKIVQDFADRLRAGSGEIACAGVPAAADAFMAVRAGKAAGLPVLAIAPTIQEAQRFAEDARFFFQGADAGSEVVLYPSYTVMPFRPVSYHNRTAAERISLLYRLSEGIAPAVTVMAVDGLLQKVIPRQDLCDVVLTVTEGAAINPEALVEKLVSGGYTRTAIVEEPGDFSVRGGIIDLFSPFHEDPARIDLFGDTVESIHFFSPVTQRRLRPTSGITVLPARETVIRKDRMGRIIAAVKKQAAEHSLPVSMLREMIDRVEQGGGPERSESLMPLVYDAPATFFDHLPAKTLVVMIDPSAIKEKAESHGQLAAELYDTARQEGRWCMPPETLYMTYEEALAGICKKPVLSFPVLPVADAPGLCGEGPETVSAAVTDNGAVSLMMRAVRKEQETVLSPLLAWIDENRNAGCASVVACGGRSQADRLAYFLTSHQVAHETVDSPAAAGHVPGRVYLVPERLSAGFRFPAEGISVITETEIFGTARRRPRPRKKGPQGAFLDLETLKQGDLVVHVDHGIGRYEGIQKVTVEGIANDFLLITYRDGDRLYLSVDRMDMARKYVGADDTEPMLDKMGGKAWGRVKAKARKEVEKIARELLDLYARRKVQEGHAFSPPGEWFGDFEAGFPFEETEDQVKVIGEVLSDMASSVPMDRLVCGDVGYGKTEIAMRASFVCASDSLQVAVLVPTTVLAEQHFATFSQRFSDYPFTLACLSRFRSPAEQKRIVADLKEGRIDIVIGTHRLLSKDVGFKRLGLVVLDEEQRFGVKHKETLKKLRATVDVLSLTATPIPRTLHMSLMGVRDISVITTPPEHRKAIKTYISEFDDAIIKTAIRKELERGGQIYFVHNNIHKIAFIADHLKKLVPEVRLGIAHGRLDQEDLEDVMMRFVDRKLDMLVCTRIIESGIDIPAANTIFVNRADLFGLAQIYQIRGRVGRSDEQAYAYLFIPRETALGRDAQKRLKVLMEHSDLGSGFQIAMNDLKIRGGGSALGVSQSGHISAVGYDMFLQLMEEAVSKLKGEPVAETLNPEINIPVSSFLSESYIPDIDQRMAIYRRLSRAAEGKELADIKAELTDRFGPLPAEAENLLLKIMLKNLAVKLGVRKLDLADTHMRLSFSGEHIPRPRVLAEAVRENSGTMEMTAPDGLKVSFANKKGRSAIVAARNVLKDLASRMNEAA